MGFLDNLESNLKSLESREERDPEAVRRAQSRRESERKNALAAAPYADALKKGPFTMDLLTHATRIGHSHRTKVHMTWLGNTLRLQAKDRRLEMQPTPEGIRATFWEGESEVGTQLVDLSGSAERLAEQWLTI